MGSVENGGGAASGTSCNVYGWATYWFRLRLCCVYVNWGFNNIKLSFIKCCLPSRIIFHKRSSFIKGVLPLPSKVIIKDCVHQRLYFIKGCLPSKVTFHHRSSSFKVCTPPKVVFRERSSSMKDRLPSKVIFHQRLSSIKSCLP